MVEALKEWVVTYEYQEPGWDEFFKSEIRETKVIADNKAAALAKVESAGKYRCAYQARQVLA